MISQMINVNELKEDLSRCKNQLKTMETVQQIVNSTEDEAIDRSTCPTSRFTIRLS